MSTNTWKTAITYIAPNEVRLRGYRIDELMGRVDFGQALYLLLRGELPDEKVGRLMTAILVSSIDHGPTPPSVVGARNAASTSAPLNACVAAGVLAINRSHGGAIEDCARTLQDVLREADREGLFDAFIGTDAVFRGPEFVAQHPWYHEVSVAPLFARVIHNINVKHSVSALLA